MQITETNGETENDMKNLQKKGVPNPFWVGEELTTTIAKTLSEVPRLSFSHSKMLAFSVPRSYSHLHHPHSVYPLHSPREPRLQQPAPSGYALYV